MSCGVGLMLFGGSLFVLSTIVLLVNFSRIAKNPEIMLEGNSMMIHTTSGAVSAASAVITVAGFILALLERFS